MTRLSSALRLIAGIVTSAALRWHSCHALRLGAAISFYSVFSLAPLLVIVTETVEIAFGRAATQGLLSEQLTGLLGDHGAHALETLIVGAHYQHTQGLVASGVAFVLTLVGASGAFVELHDAVRSIVGREEPRHGPFLSLLWARLDAFALVMGLCFLLLVSLVFSAARTALHHHLTRDIWPILATGGESLDIALLAAGFAFLIYFLPRPHPSWLAAWVGAVVASVLFTVGKWAVGLYLVRSMVSSAYGAAGSLVVVMIWVYYTSQVLLAGAALTHAVDRFRQDRGHPATDGGGPGSADPPAPAR